MYVQLGGRTLGMLSVTESRQSGTTIRGEVFRNDAPTSLDYRKRIFGFPHPASCRIETYIGRGL